MSSNCTRCGCELDESGTCPQCTLPAHTGETDPTLDWGGSAAELAQAKTIHTGDKANEKAKKKSAGRLTGAFGDYELLGEIARGGMGVVYRARHVRLDRTVALKMIASAELAGPEQVRRFRAEAEAAAVLDHPNIVSIYEVGEHDGVHYFSMKLVEGSTLAKVKAGYRGALKLAARLMIKIARAVHYAHQRGVLHRDLKPANILIDTAGEPMVTDFGVAKRFDRAGDAGLTLTGAIMGTPAYMAPEQAAGGKKELTTAADIYSLGAILYELMAGHPPFQADSPVAMLKLVQEEEPARPTTFNHKADRDLETICLKCLEKEAGRRYGSALELANDLERWLAGEPIIARATGHWERALKWARRHPAAAALVLVSLSACIGVGILALVSWRHAELRAAAVRDLDQAQRAIEEKRREVEQKGREVLLKDAQIAQKQNEITALEAARAQLMASIGTATAQARRRVYRSDLRAAGNAIASEDIAGAMRLLQPYASVEYEDLRGLEWHCIGAMCVSPSRTLLLAEPMKEDDGPVRLMAVSRDGRQVAVLRGSSGTLIVIDARSGLVRKRFVTGIRDVAAIAFSRDGGSIVLTEAGALMRPNGIAVTTLADLLRSIPVKVIEIDRSERPVDARGSAPTLVEPLVGLGAFGVRTFSGTLMTTSVAASGNGRYIACGGTWLAHGLIFGLTTGLVLFDTTKPEELSVLNGPQAGVWWVGFSADGKTMVSVGLDRSIVVWDVASSRPKMVMPGAVSLGCRPAVSGNGKMLLARQASGSIGVFDLEAGRVVATMRCGIEAPTALGIVDDGKAVAAGIGGAVKLFSVESPTPPQSVGLPANQVTGFGLRNDGVVFVADAGGIARTMQVQSGRTLETAKACEGSVAGVDRLGHTVCSADGKVAVLDVGDEQMRAWNLETGKRIGQWARPAGLPGSRLLSEDGSRMAMVVMGAKAGPTALRVWDPATQRLVLSVSVPLSFEVKLCFAGNDTLVAAGTSQGQGTWARVYDLKSGAMRKLNAPDGVFVTSIAMDGQRQWLAIAGMRMGMGSLCIVDLSTGDQVLAARALAWVPTAAAFAADRKRIALGFARSDRAACGIAITDTATGEEMVTLEAPGTRVTHVAFTPDGTKLGAVVGETNPGVAGGETRLYLWGTGK